MNYGEKHSGDGEQPQWHGGYYRGWYTPGTNTIEVLACGESPAIRYYDTSEGTFNHLRHFGTNELR